MSKSKEAIITMAIGSDYLDFYNKYFRESHERFAKKIGRKLIVLTDYIDKSDYGKQRHPSWQKLLMFKSPETAGFDRLCWIDADIYITSHSEDPFELVGKEEWGAVRNNIYNLESYAKSDPTLYAHCPNDNRPEYILNTGFFIVHRERYAGLLEYIYQNYEEQTCYEQGPLSYHLLNSPPGVELDKTFNHMLPQYLSVTKLNDRNLYSLVEESNFIHFCGGINKDILEKVRTIDNQSKGKQKILKIFFMLREKSKNVFRRPG